MYSFPKACLLTSILLALTVSFAQSLPEVARRQRLKQQARDTHAAKKVITDDDMPARTVSTDDSGPAESASNDRSSKSPSNSAMSAELWKGRILAQQNVVSSLKDDIAKLSASVHFVEVNRYSNGVQYNQYQAKKQEEVDRLQKQLEGEKKKLADLQESARRAGFGSAVYEP